jgi:hypothetical protein
VLRKTSVAGQDFNCGFQVFSVTSCSTPHHPSAIALTIPVFEKSFQLEHRAASFLRQRLGKAAAKVQSRRMQALAPFPVGISDVAGGSERYRSISKPRQSIGLAILRSSAAAQASASGSLKTITIAQKIHGTVIRQLQTAKSPHEAGFSKRFGCGGRI